MALRWYVVHVHSGFEKKVREQIQKEADLKGMTESFGEILIPAEEIKEVSRGKAVTRERKFFPGYMLVEMEMTDASWHIVADNAKVTGFLGTGKRPSPISKAEAERVIKQTEEGVARTGSNLSFDIGETVRVCDGPFENFNGVVEDADSEKQRLKLSLSIFGRETLAEVDYTQVEKLQ